MHKQFILHLTLIETIGPAVIQKIIGSGMQVSDLYSFSPIDWMNIFGFSQSTAEKLVDGLANIKILETELALIEENNIQWVTYEDEAYPQLLKNIYLPPAVLYIQGKLSSAQTTTKLLAVVGARKADEYGYRIVNQLVPELVAASYTIVSGGAVGIDAAAHAATIKSGGKTIAVLGSGLLLPYPSSNKKLFESIVKSGGCLMSSFPLLMDALPGHFPARNRIVTGLSHGCLVVQAAQKSGALISAHYALEQGREVFAIPGPIDSELSAGCNTLIQNGAKLVACTADILEEFGDRVILPDKKVMQEKAAQLSLDFLQCARPEPVEGYPRALKDSLQQVQTERERMYKPSKVRESSVDKYSNYSQQQKIIITACKKPISFDDIIIKTQLTHELLQTELFNLQLDGVIKQDFTGMWTLHS
jgi:DNA processing protein